MPLLYFRGRAWNFYKMRKKKKQIKKNMIPTITTITTTDVAATTTTTTTTTTIQVSMTNDNNEAARQQIQQQQESHYLYDEKQIQIQIPTNEYQNISTSTELIRQSLSSQLLQEQQEQQHVSQSPDTILMFPTTSTNTAANSTTAVTSKNTTLPLLSSTTTSTTGTNRSKNDTNTASTSTSTIITNTTSTAVDPIDDPNVDHSELVAQLELQVQLLLQQQEEEDNINDDNDNDNNYNTINDDDNDNDNIDNYNNNNNNNNPVSMDMRNVQQQQKHTFNLKENDSRTCTGTGSIVFTTGATGATTAGSTIPNTVFHSSGVPSTTTTTTTGNTGTTGNTTGISTTSFVKRSSSLTSLNSSSSCNNLFLHRRLPSVIDEGTDCYIDTTTTTTTTTNSIFDDNTEKITGTSTFFVSSGTERKHIPLVTTSTNSNINTDYEYSYDQLEQEESQKYSGMDVLRRITSSQKDLFLSFDNTTTNNNSNINDINTTTDSCNTDTFINHQQQRLYQQETTERSTNRIDNDNDNDDDDDDEYWLQQQDNIGSRKDQHHDTTGSSNDMRQQQQYQPNQQVVALEKKISDVDVGNITTDDTTTIHSSIVFDKITNVFIPYYTITYYLNNISCIIHLPNYDKISAVTWISFYALLVVTCSNNILSPMRDAIALHVGVTMIPLLTLCSTILALFSSVPIGWLFEAPDPSRRIVWKHLGLTRGETQGTSLALFYRLFAFLLILYSIAFCIVDWIVQHYRTISISTTTINGNNNEHDIERRVNEFGMLSNTSTTALSMWLFIDQALYIAFFLLVHLMKLHCLSLVWGVATEALEYEEEGRLTSPATTTTTTSTVSGTSKDVVTSSCTENDNTATDSGDNANNNTGNNQKRRIKRLAFIGFGGTVGGIVGSIIASTLAKLVRLSGLLILSAILLEIGAQLSIELGRIMQKHWIDQRMVYLEKVQYQQEQQAQQQQKLLQQYKHQDDNTNEYHLSRNQSGTGYEINTNDSTNNINNNNNNNSGGGFDSSMKRSVSLGSMKRVASGNSLHRVNSGASLNRIRSTSDVGTVVNDDDNLSTTSRSSLNVTTTTTTTHESVGNDFIVQSNNDTGIRRRRQVGNDSEGSHTRATNMEKESTKRVSSNSTSQPNTINNTTVDDIEEEEVNDSSFIQRLLRGMYTIFRSRLLMAIFTYNALYASTTVLLSFQRAALIADRNNNTNTTTVGSGVGSVNADTSFLANINMASSIAIFALQASGVGAYVAHLCGPRGTLSLMPIIRLLGVIALAYWHHTSNGQPPNLIYFLIVDEFCKVMNLAIAKPVRESLWRGLSNEARYEAKPIVDTLANRWGGGSAAFLVTFVDRTVRAMNTVAKYHNQNNDSSSSSSNKMEQQSTLSITDDNEPVQVFGFPTIVFLCIIISAWWVVVSADLGFIRKNIDIDLKKRQ